MSDKNKNENKQETLASTTSQQTTNTTTTIGSGTNTLNPNMQYGWVCPKCGKVNAPWKDSCNCHLNTPYTPPNTPTPTPFNPMPYWPQAPEVGDVPGWWQYGPSCTPIPCIITATDKTNISTSITNESKIPSGQVYRTSKDSPIYASSRPQTCRAKTCDVCDLLNHPELCGIERMYYSSKTDEFVNGIGGLKNSIDKKLGG